MSYRPKPTFTIKQYYTHKKNLNAFVTVKLPEHYLLFFGCSVANRRL